MAHAHTHAPLTAAGLATPGPTSAPVSLGPVCFSEQVRAQPASRGQEPHQTLTRATAPPALSHGTRQGHRQLRPGGTPLCETLLATPPLSPTPGCRSSPWTCHVAAKSRAWLSQHSGPPRAALSPRTNPARLGPPPRDSSSVPVLAALGEPDEPQCPPPGWRRLPATTRLPQSGFCCHSTAGTSRAARRGPRDGMRTPCDKPEWGHLVHASLLGPLTPASLPGLLGTANSYPCPSLATDR